MDHGPLVLLVDDEIETLDAMSACLAPLGIRLARARDGREALDLVERLAPAAMVLDLLLPGTSGAQVLTELRSRGSEIPVVIVSGVGSSHKIGDAIELVPKPFDARTLREAVRRALGHR